MAQLTRQTPALFSGNTSAAGTVGVFGSLAVNGAGSTSTVPNTIQSLSAWQNGWTGAVLGTNQPCLEDMNGLFYWMSYYINYAMQTGVPEYDPNTTYYQNNIVSNQNNSAYPYGIYVSQTSVNNANQALNNPSYWLPLSSTLSGPNVCKAWVTFDGTTNSGGQCTILGTALNVSSVTYVSTGQYVINFTNALPTQNYAWSGSAGTQNGIPSVSGDNNVITGGLTGYTGLKTTTQLQVFCWEAYGGGTNNEKLENSSCISVIVFGN